MSAWSEIRAGRRKALAFLRIGDDFSPSQCAVLLRALRTRLQNELRAIHDRDDRADHLELIETVSRQITALEMQE